VCFKGSAKTPVREGDLCATEASDQRIGLITKVTNEKNVRKREEIALASHYPRVKESVDASNRKPRLSVLVQAQGG